MKVIKILGVKYDKNELNANSIIIRKWLICNQIEKKEIPGKYHTISDTNLVEKRYEELIGSVDKGTKKFYNEYLNESWTETFPIMKDVSAYEKIRAKDGVEFCVLLN